MGMVEATTRGLHFWPAFLLFFCVFLCSLSSRFVDISSPSGESFVTTTDTAAQSPPVQTVRAVMSFNPFIANPHWKKHVLTIVQLNPHWIVYVDSRDLSAAQDFL